MDVEPQAEPEAGPQVEPQNDLEHLLIMAGEDPAYRPLFYRELVRSNILAIQRGEPPAEPEARVATEGDKLEIMQTEFEGKLYIPIFTSLPHLQTVIGETVTYIEVNALEFMKVTQGAPLLLNPGSPYGKEFIPEEIAAIVDGSLWDNIEHRITPEGTEAMIGEPFNYPEELAGALERFFATKPEVSRAWMAQFYNPADGQPPHILIGVELDGDVGTVMNEAGMVIRSIDVQEPAIDLIRVTGQEGPGLDEYFLQKADPFYQRATA